MIDVDRPNCESPASPGRPNPNAGAATTVHVTASLLSLLDRHGFDDDHLWFNVVYLLAME